MTALIIRKSNRKYTNKKMRVGKILLSNNANPKRVFGHFKNTNSV